MFLTSFLNIYLICLFLSIYFEAMLFIILLKNCRQSKFKMLFYAVFKKHSQTVDETYVVPAIQLCLICSTLPVEFNKRDRNCLDELFKS